MIAMFQMLFKTSALGENDQNTEFSLVCIFQHSDRIRRDTLYLSVFNPNAGKYGPGQTPYLDTFHTVLVNFNKEVPRDFLLVFTYSLADGCILFINSYNFEEKFYFKNVLCYVVMWNLFTVGSLQFSIEVLQLHWKLIKTDQR